MKILVVQDRLRSGGTERQSLLLSRAFASAGHAVTLLTFRPGGVLAPEVRGPGGFSWHSLQRFDTGLDWFAPGLIAFVEKASPDVVLCQGRMANCYAAGIQDAFRDDSPRIAVVATFRTGKPLPRLYRRSLRRARHIVANSAEARDRLVSEHGLAPDRIAVIRNSLIFPAVGASRSSFRPWREKFGAGPRTKVLLCVAMFRPEKNQGELVEIVGGLPPESDWQLWLAGEGPALAGCQRLVERRGLAGRIKFPGYLSEPASLYAEADIAVHASWSEALSNFLIEAQARGIPAVALDAQGIRECFIPEKTGWAIPRGDHASFREAVLRLMSATPSDQSARSAAAAEYARESFDPDRQVAAYLTLFARLAGRSERTPSKPY